MSDSQRRVIGIDGGGTKTVAWLANVGPDGQTRVLGKGYAGASNYRSVGFDSATKNLRAAMEEAFKDAGLPLQTVDGICLGLAGADREVERERLTAWANESQLARDVVVTNDAVPILFAAATEGAAMGLISGTGSLAIGRGDAGETLRCGGWGGLFGDEGSGYQIAIEALRAAARAADGRGPKTSLLASFMEHFRIDAFDQVIPIVYDDTFQRADLARLATKVFEAAAQGDAVAKEIIERAADQLAEMVASVARRLGASRSEIPLAITGGVLIHHPEFVESIVNSSSLVNLPSLTVCPVPEPVSGAVSLAGGRLS